MFYVAAQKLSPLAQRYFVIDGGIRVLAKWLTTLTRIESTSLLLRVIDLLRVLPFEPTSIHESKLTLKPLLEQCKRWKSRSDLTEQQQNNVSRLEMAVQSLKDTWRSSAEIGHSPDIELNGELSGLRRELSVGLVQQMLDYIITQQNTQKDLDDEDDQMSIDIAEEISANNFEDACGDEDIHLPFVEPLPELPDTASLEPPSPVFRGHILAEKHVTWADTIEGGRLFTYIPQESMPPTYQHIPCWTQ